MQNSNNVMDNDSDGLAGPANRTAPDLGTNLPLIQQYIRIALRWKWVILGSIAAAFVIGLIITLLMTPQYSASSQIEIARQQDKIVKVESVTEDSNPADAEFYQTQYGLLESRSLAQRVAKELRVVDDPGFFDRFDVPLEEAGSGSQRLGTKGRAKRLQDSAEILLDNLNISPVRGSSLVEVEFTSPDPEFSARVANAWVENFIETNLERRFDSTSYARDFLENRLVSLKQRLEESERLLVNYGANQNIVSIPGSGASGSNGRERTILAADLANLNYELGLAVADRVKAESKLRGLGQAVGASSEALNNSAITGMRQKRAEVASEYAKLLVQFEEGYPTVQALATQMQDLDRSIATEERRVYNSFKSAFDQSLLRQGALQKRVDQLTAQLNDEQGRSIQYNIYQREVDTNRQLYDALLQRYKEIGVAGGVGTNNISVVDIAEVPGKPSSPRLLLNLLLSLVAGSVCGIGLAFALEQIDETISDPGQVKSLLDLPLLGTIPSIAGSDPNEALGDRKSPVVEAYLAVQTNLEFSTSRGIPKSIMVTSTRPAEGKSTTSFALANSLARSKRRVVLVDADMRSPSVHQMFGVDNAKGLSNYLAGDDDLASIIVYPADGDYAIISAGPRPLNAADLLTGPRFDLLKEKLLVDFDHIVFDSPPVVGLADAPLIASKVESTIFVVESHGIRTSLVQTAIARLKAANAQVVGVVLTKFEAKRSHYGYGYDYGYGYGGKDDV